MSSVIIYEFRNKKLLKVRNIKYFEEVYVES